MKREKFIKLLLKLIKNILEKKLSEESKEIFYMDEAFYLIASKMRHIIISEKNIEEE